MATSKVAEGRSCKRGVRGERNEVQSGNTQQGMVAPAAACSECQEGASIWRVYASIWRVRWRRRRHRARHREQIYFLARGACPLPRADFTLLRFVYTDTSANVCTFTLLWSKPQTFTKKHPHPMSAPSHVHRRGERLAIAGSHRPHGGRRVRGTSTRTRREGGAAQAQRERRSGALPHSAN